MIEWTDSRIALLISLWSDPWQSARLIAKRLGVTRNAVIGKAHRLGLAKKPRLVRFSPQLCAEVGRLYKRGLPWLDIVEVTGIPLGSLAHVFDIAGVKRNGRYGARR